MTGKGQDREELLKFFNEQDSLLKAANNSSARFMSQNYTPVPYSSSPDKQALASGKAKGSSILMQTEVVMENQFTIKEDGAADKGEEKKNSYFMGAN